MSFKGSAILFCEKKKWFSWGFLSSSTRSAWSKILWYHLYSTVYILHHENEFNVLVPLYNIMVHSFCTKVCSFLQFLHWVKRYPFSVPPTPHILPLQFRSFRSCNRTEISKTHTGLKTLWDSIQDSMYSWFKTQKLDFCLYLLTECTCYNSTFWYFFFFTIILNTNTLFH